MFVTIQRENIRPSKERNEQGCYDASKLSDFLQLGYESLRLLIADQYEVFRPPACFALPPSAVRTFTPPPPRRDQLVICGQYHIGSRANL
jgi:hypothetical protein